MNQESIGFYLGGKNPSFSIACSFEALTPVLPVSNGSFPYQTQRPNDSSSAPQAFPRWGENLRVSLARDK